MSAGATPRPGPPVVAWSAIAWMAVYAAAMGWLEAVVVVYIRTILGFHDAAIPPAPQTLMHELARLPWLIPTEQTRELATLVMLAAVGWLTGRSAGSRLGAFLASFGVWDIVYYVALFALIHWPPSVTERDLLFLVPPHPWWIQPIWVPVAISSAMIAGGVMLMRRRAAARPD